MNHLDSPRPRWTLWLFVGLPVWLIVSAAVAVWWQWRKGPDSPHAAPDRRFSRHISAKPIADDLLKLRTFLGERSTSSPAAKKSLARTAVWISGTLGPSNNGYDVHQIPGPDAAPLIDVKLAGEKADPAIWLIAAYDSPLGSHGPETNASGLAALLAIASEMAIDRPARSLHFLFLPHGHDAAAPIAETVKRAANHILSKGTPAHIFCIEAMGVSDSLHLSATAPTKIPGEALLHLITLDDASKSVEPLDGLASHFAKLGLPAAKISTGLAGTQDPAPARVARNASALTEFVRRLANRK